MQQVILSGLIKEGRHGGSILQSQLSGELGLCATDIEPIYKIKQEEGNSHT